MKKMSLVCVLCLTSFATVHAAGSSSGAYYKGNKPASSTPKTTTKKDSDLDLNKTETKLVPSNKGMYSNVAKSSSSSHSSSHK